jgi:hypothetical protein
MALSLSLVLRELQGNNSKLNGSLAGNLVGALALIAAGVLPADAGLRVAFLGSGAFVALCSRATVENVKRLYILLEEIEGLSYGQVAGAIASEFAPSPLPIEPSTKESALQPPSRIAVPDILPDNVTEELQFFDWNLFNLDPNKWPHLAIVGGTGDGKSYTTERLVTVLDGEILICHPHKKPSDYPGYRAIYGGGRNYGDWDNDRPANFDSLLSGNAGKISCASFLKGLEEEMDLRYKRYEQGDESYPMINVILDELNTTLSKLPAAVDCLKNLLRESRKVKIRLFCLLQSDSVKSLKLEGEGVLRHCFRFVRLGEFAVSHARRLRNPNLTEWISSQRFPLLVEDVPATLDFLLLSTTSTGGCIGGGGGVSTVPLHYSPPLLHQGFTTPPHPLHSTDPPPQNWVFPDPFSPISPELERAILACKNLGYSQTKTILAVWGIEKSGSDPRYQAAREKYLGIVENSDSLIPGKA